MQLDHSLPALVACAGQPMSKPPAASPIQQRLFDLLLFVKTASFAQLSEPGGLSKPITGIPFSRIQQEFPQQPAPTLLRDLTFLVRRNNLVLIDTGYLPR